MTAQTLPEKIAYRLRRDILRGKLPPGAPIKERDFAAEEDVSRMPVREAIRILAQEGLVMLRPSRSPIVAQLSFKEVADQTEVLIALEKLSAELACRNASDADVDRLAEITDRIAAQFDQMDPLDMFELDMSFHRAIAAASGNRALAETHSSYLARLWRIRYLAASQRRNRERVVTEHRRIIAAVRNRDPSAARDAIDNHLWHLAEDIRELIEAEGPNANPKDPARST
ncbi:GntR family transcriptional regulator [Defluviimonas sp. 20V17]|uniref:Transcriptional regulator n=1 Tax=Allgaiera indica TaxID=765699 RepID=A0AAN5A204_9RHOB|nr:GntR family transcriptional regulator [Allgaiera indica]KDB04793.1 GntR family transcriptional regulator [Defluviimonas sp. 20V17]GHE05093.1 transcriptional regulator [Allgaiera indica]SDX66804.1 transcriptional regulator, GntR family [Allgaiera indica]